MTGSCRLRRRLARGQDALAHLSRNARTREAGLLVAALGACTRTQLARALELSRAGADIQARTLADAGLVDLALGGRIAWARLRQPEVAPQSLDRGPLAGAVLDPRCKFDRDRSVARANRRLARRGADRRSRRALQPSQIS